MDLATSTRSPSSGELRATLETLVHRSLGRQRSIQSLSRRPAAARSSFLLEEVDLRLDDGTQIELVFKDLSRSALLESAAGAKPAFLYEPRREIETYGKILASHPLGTAACFGAVSDPASDRYWLFLERVPGIELAHIGDFTVWQETARWLARMHVEFADRADRLTFNSRLIQYTPSFYQVWPRRARAFLDRWGPLPDAWAEVLERLFDRYDIIAERLYSLPTTLLHGEFYAPNVLVQRNRTRLRICPVDWEMAAVGPALIDLAALVAGRWTEAQKTALALAYYSAWTAAGGAHVPPQVFLTALEYCRLHVAVQWLGWSETWSPPPQYAQDWVGEAVRLAAIHLR